MEHEKDNTPEVRRTIERLIETGSAYDVDQLDLLYHERLEVFIIDANGEVTTFDKASNMAVFREKRDSGAEPLSRWARFNYVQATGDRGFVVVTRRMSLRGRPEKFVLAIQLVYADLRWQVIHETVFVQPDEPE